MLTVRTVSVTPLPAHVYDGVPEGERGTIICDGGEIPVGIVQLLPEYTRVIPLVVNGGRRSYCVDVRGTFTIEDFVRIVMLFKAESFEAAYAKIHEVMRRL